MGEFVSTEDQLAACIVLLKDSRAQAKLTQNLRLVKRIDDQLESMGITSE